MEKGKALPDPKGISVRAEWSSGGKYPEGIGVRMSDGAVVEYSIRGETHPAFLRALEILRGWRPGRHEKRG